MKFRLVGGLHIAGHPTPRKAETSDMEDHEMSNAKSTSKAPTPAQELEALQAKYDQRDAGPEDPAAEGMAVLRAELETLRASVARLQELQADAILWADCPCGQDYRTTSQLTNAVIRNGRLWHDQGHYSFFGARVEQ